MDKIQIGENIRYLRDIKGYTQVELAKKIGVNHCTVAGWESGRVNIKQMYVKALCEALYCKEEEILGFGCKGRDAQKTKLIEMFESLSEDNKHLLLVRARELQLLEEECYKTEYMAS